MADLLAQADRAFVEEDFDEAVRLYTEALSALPNSANIYESRAHAHIKLENYLDAVEDASKALELDPNNVKAHLRKGVACFHLDEFEAAKDAFEAGRKLAPDNSQLRTWIRKCDAELEESGTAPQPTPAPSSSAAAPAPAPIQPIPAPAAAPAPAPAPAPSPAAALAPAPAAAASQPSTSGSGTPALAPAAPAAFEGKYRHQWYQLQSKVTVDVYAKGLAKEQVSVSFEPQHLCVVITTPGGQEEYRLEVDTYGPIKPSECRYEVLRTKIEITMTKEGQVQWGTLERSTKVAAPNYSNPAAEPVTGKYPSSYAKAPKDWDKVEGEIKDLEEKGDLDFGDPLSNFFKKIFSQGDEDQRRAMMKSFQESNGTVLSTNWDEVGKKKVDCTPPEGMVAKKWGEN